MPKASPSSDPAKAPADEQSRDNEISLRKKKNADAQAAFRARRASYITTLEETVHNLESVVLQLQESCREAHSESAEWKQQCLRIRLEFREREKYWRCLLQSTKSGHTNGDDVPSLPPPANAAAALLQPPNAMGVHVGPAHQLQYGDQNNMDFRNDESCPPAYPGSDHSSYTTSPSIPMVEPADPTLSPEDPSGRLTKYGHYNYSVHTASPRDPRWPIQQQVAMCGGEGHQPSQSPVYLESPSLTATDMAFSSRSFGAAPEDDKVQLHTVLENAPYTFSNDERYAHRLAENSVPASRSLSPSTSTPASTVATLGPVYPFTFPDPATRFNDRGEVDMRRHSLPHGGEVPLQGGPADLSSLSGLTASDALRYRLGTRKSGTGPDSQHPCSTPMPSIPSSSSALNGAVENTNDNGGCGSSSSGRGHHDRATSDSDSNGAPLSSRLRRRRGTHHTSSRSPSPGPPSLSCTVAVIKAQAFGALRRTRARGKKSSEGAAKVAMDVLEARGIGIGGPTSSKRPRLDNEALTMET